MKKYFIISSLAALAALSLITGCETYNSGRSSNTNYANSSQDISELRNQVAILKRQLANTQNNNARISEKLSSLQAQINYVNEQNQQQNKSISALDIALQQEKKQRQAAMDKVVETVADQTARTINTIASTSQPGPPKTSGPVASGAYYKHKVESGETLSAIARAYKVSVSDIKQANNIKSHIIRVGQILHIPKK